LAILRGCLGVDVVGGDVVEVAPQYDPTTNTAQIAGQVLFTLLCLAGAALQVRRAGAVR
jgi:agmatinase